MKADFACYTQYRNAYLSMAAYTFKFREGKVLPDEAPEYDAMLICSHGFSEKIDTTEMEIDYTKAVNAKDWLNIMLLRIFERSLNIEGVCASAYIYEPLSV